MNTRPRLPSTILASPYLVGLISRRRFGEIFHRYAQAVAKQPRRYQLAAGLLLGGLGHAVLLGSSAGATRGARRASAGRDQD